MPLTAYVDGDRVIGPLLDTAGWAAIRTREVVLDCGARAVPKQSRRGTQFFAHWPGSHCEVVYEPESAEHLAVKEEVLRAAIAAGWTAAVEVPAEDRSWIADVLVTDGTHRIALEVQWSYQTADEYHFRQDRYRKAGIDCYWFSRHRRTVAGYDVRVPVFKLAKQGDGSFTSGHGVNTGGRWEEHEAVPVRDVVTGLLGGYPERRWVPLEDHRRGVRIHWRWEKCWSCERWLQPWMVDDLSLFRCLTCQEITERYVTAGGLGASLTSNPWPAALPREFQPDVLRAATRELDKPAGTSFRSTKKMPTPHHGYACPHCRAPISFALMMGKHWNDGQSILATAPTTPIPASAGGHWCQDAGSC